MNYAKKVLLLCMIVLLMGGSLLQAESLKAKVKVLLANVRAEASEGSRVIKRVPQGTVLQVLGKSGQWYRVEIPAEDGGTSLTGFVFGGIVDIIGEAPVAKDIPAATAPQKPGGSIAPAATGISDQSKDHRKLVELAELIRQDSTALLTLLQKMAPQVTRTQKYRTKRWLKVIRANCRILETDHPDAAAIFTPYLNDELEVIKKRDRFYKVRLKDRREGWVSDDFVQEFAVQEEIKKIEYANLETCEYKSFISVSRETFERIASNKLVSDQIYKKYRGYESSPSGSYRGIIGVYRSIEKYYQYAFHFYNKYISEEDVQYRKSKLYSLSAWAELLAGSTSYSTEFLNGTLSENKGMSTQISAEANLELNDRSAVSGNFAFFKDVLHTPFSTTDFGAGYTYTNEDNLNLEAGVNLNNYNDLEDKDYNYSRFSLSGGADYMLNDRIDLNLDYSFLNNSYTEDSSKNYTVHDILLDAQLKQTGNSLFAFQMRTQLSSSERDFHNYTNMEPSLTYEKKGLNSSLTVRGGYESFRFSKKGYMTFNRLAVDLQTTRNRDNLFGTLDIGVVNKSYPENEDMNYLRLYGTYSKSASGEKSNYFNASFNTDLYLKVMENSFTDLRLAYGHISKQFFSDLSAHFRVWHQPGWNSDTVNSKPFTFDLAGKLGLNFGKIRVGPTFGLFAQVSAEEGVEFFEREGNLVRLGGILEGEMMLPAQIKLLLNAAYEYGFVYDNEIMGDILTRHPTTIQISADVSKPILKCWELIGQVKYYRIATDMDEMISINPAVENNRFILLFGIRYRCN